MTKSVKIFSIGNGVCAATQEDIDNFKASIDDALKATTAVVVTHHAVDVLVVDIDMDEPVIAKAG